MRKCVWLLSPIVGIAGVGYWSSDARALDNLAHRERLNTPNRVFGYVTGHWSQAHADPVHPGESLQTMLTRPSFRLWCDEGAIVLALLNQRLQSPTRLVDVLDQRRGIPLATTVPYQAISRYRSYPSSPLH